jgi:AmpE protein
VGAWLFRVSDLLRRRAVFEVERDPVMVHALDHISAIHGTLGWIPARLAALGYAVSGSYDDAFSRWRAYSADPAAPFYHSNDQLVATVGCGALSLEDGDAEGADHGARKAMRLVTRTIFVWTTVIALMTLPGWA